MTLAGRGKCAAVGIDVGLTVKRFTRKTHPRACGQAARRLPRLTVQPTGHVCKRRDAVRLALHEPARPAGAAFGVLSGATVSWAAISSQRTQLLDRYDLSTTGTFDTTIFKKLMTVLQSETNAARATLA